MTVRVVALVPAGGESRRMGTNKLTLPWGKTTVLGHVTGELVGAALDFVLVVLGPKSTNALALVLRPAEVFLLPEQTTDMRSTIEAGMNEYGSRFNLTDNDGVLIALADQPTIHREVFKQLASSYRERPGVVHISTFDGRRAHPVVIPWKRLRELTSLPPNFGLNALVRTSVAVEVPVSDRGVMEDLDHPADYQRLSGSCDS